ncbi:metalloprotease 1 [Beauveria brongniartii RCEF 3172]|uniref:Metalloprotease 1 n=1 Tax=Beauveria brongniartii RCEF 3172 TaxID=1081107 RepID=A0A167ATD6_9HYPO|nr:metalloprotease 1 [Beauveria brongniartii RCEF 3172]
MTRFLTLLLPFFLALVAVSSTADPTLEDGTRIWCQEDLELESSDPAPFYDSLPLHDDTSLGPSLVESRQAQQYPDINFRVFGHVVYANKTVQGGYVAKEDVVSVVEMLNQDFGRFGISFTHVNTSYTQNETLATVTDRQAMHNTMTRGMRRGQYADLNLFWVAYLVNATGSCTLPERRYLNGELSWETVVPTDACAMRATTIKAVNGKIITHEVGHWLGLLHPWEKGCDIGDYIDDTWPQEMATRNIPIDQRREDNGGEVFQCGAWRPSNYRNFMDYFPGRNSFTDLQGQRMRAYGYLRHKYCTERRPLSAGESELWAGCQVKWNGPKSFAHGFACQLKATDALSLSCATKPDLAGSTEQFVIEARCPLEWVGPLELHDGVICEELNFNHIRCKPSAVPQVPNHQSDPENTKSEPKEHEQDDEEEKWVWAITDN